MDINTNLIIQIALCTLLFVAIFFLMRATTKTEEKLDKVHKEN